MKIIYLSVILIFLSCQQSIKNTKNLKKDGKLEYDKKLNLAISSNVRNDKIFLGYEFGMTMEEFQLHTEQLIDENKVISLKQIFEQANSYEDNYMRNNNVVFKSESGPSVQSLYALRLYNEMTFSRNSYKYKLVYNENGDHLDLYYDRFITFSFFGVQKLNELTLKVKNVPSNFNNPEEVRKDYPIRDKIPTLISIFEKKYGNYIYLEKDEEKNINENGSYNWFNKNQLIKVYFRKDTRNTGHSFIIIKYIDIIELNRKEKEEKEKYTKRKQEQKVREAIKKEKNKNAIKEALNDI